MNYKKYAVYLSEPDWRAVIGVLKVHTPDEPPHSAGSTTWKVGRNLLRSIIAEIESRLPEKNHEQR